MDTNTNRYRVEFRINSKNYFRKDCNESQLSETKDIIKAIQNEEKRGVCFYRKFPLNKELKTYF